ncbi:MAG: hypothetical protein ABGF52_11995, partial [Candidatus Asgardarchaeum sp.]
RVPYKSELSGGIFDESYLQVVATLLACLRLGMATHISSFVCFVVFKILRSHHPAPPSQTAFIPQI